MTIPTKAYIDGGFQPVEGGQFISTADAKVLARWIAKLKLWGSDGWDWITDYYITELEKFKDSIPTE